MIKIRDVVNDVIKDIGLETAMAERRVLELWPEVAGPKLAERAVAVQFKQGILFVAVESSSLRTDLTMRVPEFLSRFRDRIGRPTVERIRFGRRSER
jgi:predicted nucleic acid-binding Zn ribbon protein